MVGDFMKAYNSFQFSDDNKRYHTWNYYLKHRFQQKVFKVALNAGFTCPNRDGTCGYGGCTFCGALGSGEFAGDKQTSLYQQFEQGKQLMLKKWPTGQAMAYFQAYSNTYAPLHELQAAFDPFMARYDVVALSIATRADCLAPKIIEYLETLTQHKEIWIELGLQSIHDDTAKLINRGHSYAVFADCVKRLAATKLKVCVHIINSLPYETEEMMLETARTIASLPIHAVKIHMLHMMEDTQLAKQYAQQPFPILSKEQYVSLVVSQLELLPASMIIQRVTGDGDRHKLIAPTWTLDKRSVLNAIDQELVRRSTWQGKRFE